jgi:hypothetical protein
MSRLSVLAAVLALATTLSSLPAVAQQNDRQIAGTVRDATKTATPGATVTAADRTGQKRVATSGSNGAY